MLGAVLLNFDGLMLDTEMAEYTALKEIFFRHGRSLSYSEWHATVGRESPDWFGRLATPDTTQHRLLTLEAERLQAAELAREPLLHGVEELLDTAESAGIPVGVVTSWRARQVKGELRRRELMDRLSVVVTRDDVTAAKPEPEPYLEALKRLDVDASAALAFEDSRQGVAAATAAGIRCVAVYNRVTHDHDFDGAEMVVDRLDRLDLHAVLRGTIALAATPASTASK